MAAFYPSFLADSVFSPNDPIKNPSFFDEVFPDFDQIYASFEKPPLIHQLGSLINNESSCLEQQSHSNDENEPLMSQKQRSESFTSMADKPENEEQVSQILVPVVDKKRKIHKGFPLNSANFKEVKQAKWKKQKGSKEGMKDVKTEKKGEDSVEAIDEPPTKGYVHVRARRGQATDSHSLAERARREKISQKMKALQALVPGCDKVTGKALMLDEIINYVQSLQNQVEFLSMKLASLDPMLHIFGLMDYDTMAFGIEGLNNGMALPMFSMQPANSNSINRRSLDSSLTFTNSSVITKSNTVATTSAFPNPLVDSSTRSFHHDFKPTNPLQDARSSYWGLDDPQRQITVNQFGFRANNNNNLYSF